MFNWREKATIVVSHYILEIPNPAVDDEKLLNDQETNNEEVDDEITNYIDGGMCANTLET